MVQSQGICAGLGLRRGMLPMLSELADTDVDFLEVAPENWIGVGGRFGRQLRSYTERVPLFCHGLSLSLGGPAPIDRNFVSDVKVFLDEFNVSFYSEHLSWCSDDKGHLYDLMPIPFTDEAVSHTAGRIRRIQDQLERTLIIENVSYYAAPAQAMAEVDFINAVLAEADCQLLLDVNNVFVNSINFDYDPEDFMSGLDLSRVAYLHIAGHFEEAQDLRVDTHGADVIEPVWQLLESAYSKVGPLPTLLERDFNFPSLEGLLSEVHRIRTLQAACSP
jgi:uncharacterized protein (UPF0276 family)